MHTPALELPRNPYQDWSEDQLVDAVIAIKDELERLAGAWSYWCTAIAENEVLYDSDAESYYTELRHCLEAQLSNIAEVRAEREDKLERAHEAREGRMLRTRQLR